MVRVWYMDDSTEDQRLEHQRSPPELLSLNELYENCGVEYFKLNPKTYLEDGELEKIKQARGYTYEDEIKCSRECLPNYEEKLRNFFTEHLHTDEEIRLVLEGSGYFDVRDRNDNWIRIEVVPGDMIVIPSGIYHRFTLDTKNYIRAKRFFIGEPVWTPHNRPCDEMECRKSYLEKLEKGFNADGFMLDIVKLQNESISFLSPNVYNLVIGVRDVFKNSSEIYKPYYVTQKSTFNWDMMEPIFNNLQDRCDILTHSFEWFKNVVVSLWPIYSEGYHYMVRRNLMQDETFWANCKWTRKERELQEYYKEYLNQKCTTLVEIILYLTSILERSLGNIYLLKGKCVPFLLRELLASSELESVLGHIPVYFLQILMGCPHGLNLRNIAWHGFLLPHEVYPEFGATLFITIASIGEILTMKYIDISEIPFRNQTILQLQELSYYFPNISEHIFQAKILLYKSTVISDVKYWEAILEYFSEGRYGKCLLLMLPQIEHILRSVFCITNNCPERMRTAEAECLYITLDEILAENLPCGKENSVNGLLGEPLLEMLSDIFMYPSGPNIRDHVSHGECDLEDINFEIANVVLFTALCVIFIAEEDLGKHGNFVSDNLLGNLDYYIYDPSCLISVILKSYQDYSSQFHCSSLIKKSLSTTVRNLQNWRDFGIPSCKRRMWELSNVNCFELTDAFLQLKVSISSQYFDYNLQERICNVIMSTRVKVLFRSKSETILLSILRKISISLNVICLHVEELSIEKYNFYVLRQLSSRQRDTYQRMLDILPSLQITLMMLVLVVLIFLQNTNNISSGTPLEINVFSKNLKRILNYVEKLSSFSSRRKNLWNKIDVVIKSIHEHIRNIAPDIYAALYV